MQASKIIVHKTYAVRRDGELARFVVNAVVQRRTRNTGSPHDYAETYVEGYFAEPNDNRREAIKLQPEKILGEYDEYAELVERKKAEEAEKKKQQDEAEEKLNRLLRLLYEATGTPVPNDYNSYNHPFRIGYNKIEIGKEGVTALTKLLENVAPRVVQN